MVQNKTITIIGGGLCGLTCALLLNRAGFEINLVEKKTYPFHRVCGEYISNEVLPFFKTLNIDIKSLEASSITKLAISSPSGKLFETNLDLGGFGLSRFTMDNFLFEKAENEGIKFFLNTKATDIKFEENVFEVRLFDNTILKSSYVISAYGKRSNLDKNRAFFGERSPYIGVKYHIKTDFPKHLVQLDNFEGGYCGIVKIEGDRYNLCYLSENKHLKKFGHIEEMENQILFKNPLLKHRFLDSDFLNEKPDVINEISFEKKPLVENHVLFCGDAAGMISPLCGNGMAMAIHSAKILAETLIEHHQNRNLLETIYQNKWNIAFLNRLKTGKIAQRLFGSTTVSEIAVGALRLMPQLSNHIIKRTHGRPF